MAGKHLIIQQCFKGVARFGQLHFIVLAVNTVVALAADINALIELLFVVMLTEMRAAVHLARDKVVECEGAFTLAEWAGSLFLVLDHSSILLQPCESAKLSSSTS